MNVESKSQNQKENNTSPKQQEAKEPSFKDHRREDFDLFVKEIEAKETNEEKLSSVVEFMRKALAQFGDPDFKGFWEARRLCLPIFKENINPIVRVKLWDEFVNLSQEARKLKDILDEEAVFAKEQLEIAINALEIDIEDYDNKVKQMLDVKFPFESEFLKPKYSEYNEKQRELNLLNAFAGRINSLRKEIIKIGMRLRYKSKFLKTLSACGDKVFPKRKELIKEISSLFSTDIKEFLCKYFGEERELAPFYMLKNEIKSLQNIAKIITLNTKAFTETRLNLSKCWDEIKVVENEKKKDFLEKRKDLKENYDNISKLIAELEEKCKADISVNDAEKASLDISNQIKSTDLIRGDVRILREKLHNSLRPITEKQEIEKEKYKQKKIEELKIKNEMIEAVIGKIEGLIKEEDKYDLDSLVKEKETILEQLQTVSLSKMEKQKVDRVIKPLKDILIDKKEKAILNLSDDQLESLVQMKEVLSQRIERRNTIKKQLEISRKEAGSSGLDFEKAMMHREMMDMEKERLDKINDLIEEVESKISEIEG